MAAATVKKTVAFRSRKLLDAAAGQPCVLCGRYGSTVPAHLPGAFYGMPAGTGQKTHDWLAAHLCNEPQADGSPSCHELMDSEWRMDPHVRLTALCKTLERLFDEGTLRVN